MNIVKCNILIYKYFWLRNPDYVYLVTTQHCFPIHILCEESINICYEHILLNIFCILQKKENEFSIL